MKIPKTFVPEKNGLDTKITQLLEQPVYENTNSFGNGWGIEPEAYRVLLLSFDKSLERLKTRGYEHHLYPWEYFKIIIDHLEDKVYRDLNRIAEDIINYGNEWVNMIVQRKNDKLFCFANPKNIRYHSDEYAYVSDKELEFDCRTSKEFDVKGLPSNAFVELDQFSNDFVEYFYTRQFKHLPEEMRGGRYKAKFFLPPNDYSLHPIQGGMGDSKFSIINLTWGYSRGCVKR